MSMAAFAVELPMAALSRKRPISAIDDRRAATRRGAKTSQMAATTRLIVSPVTYGALPRTSDQPTALLSVATFTITSSSLSTRPEEACSNGSESGSEAVYTLTATTESLTGSMGIVSCSRSGT